MTNNLLKKSRKVTLLLVLASSLILLPSFLLLMASSWNSDDYFIAKLYQDQGLNGLFQRMFTWSPRFFSEIILYLYYKSVPFMGKPFTGGMLFILWLFLMSSIFIFIQETTKKHSLLIEDKKINLDQENIYLKLLFPLLITLILLTYFLTSQNPSEMFYVIASSTAYILTLAGIIFNLNFFINQSDSQRISNGYIFYLIIFGIITSSSWEMGAIYQLFFSSCLFLMLLLTTFSTKFNYLPFSNLDKFNRWKLSIANLIPFCLSLYILFLLKSNRVGTVEANNIESPFTGNFQASLITSFLEFFKEIFFLNKPAWETNLDFYSFTYSVVYKLGLLFLLITLFYLANIKLNIVTRNACYISIFSLLITNFIITFSSYYQLGISSYPRQTSFKSALIGISLLIIALIIASYFLDKSDKFRIIAILNNPVSLIIIFCLTLSLLINLQFKYLKQDLSNLNKMIVINNQNWQKSLDSDQSLARYTKIPTGYIFRIYLETGLYPSCNKSDELSEYANRYMNYFNKKKLYVTSIDSQLMDLAFDSSLNNKEKINFICSNHVSSIDLFNKNPITNSVIEVPENQPIELMGWAVNPDQTKAKKVIITTGENHQIVAEAEVNIPRPDVADYFNNSTYFNSGWSISFIPTIEPSKNPVKFSAWAYNPDEKEAYLFKEFDLKFLPCDNI